MDKMGSNKPHIKIIFFSLVQLGLICTSISLDTCFLNDNSICNPPYTGHWSTVLQCTNNSICNIHHTLDMLHWSMVLQCTNNSICNPPYTGHWSMVLQCTNNSICNSLDIGLGTVLNHSRISTIV